MAGSVGGGRLVLPRALVPSRWPLWKQSSQLIAYALLVEVAVVVWNAESFDTWPTAHLWRLALLICGFGIAQSELSRQAERLRRRSTGSQSYINLTSVWTFSAVLLLPPILVTVVVVVLYAHRGVRSPGGVRRVPVYRNILNAALVTVTCLTTDVTLRATGFAEFHHIARSDWTGLGAVTLALAVYFVVGAAVVVPALKVESRSMAAVLGTFSENFVEFSTLCVGAMVAAVIVVLPGLSIAVLPVMILVQRSMLVSHLELEADTDVKTGVLNTGGWYAQAERQLGRVHRSGAGSLAVLMIDLDHFKAINDRFGHVAGDEVLKIVAATIVGEVRDSDAVGRFGGEEFVVQLSDAALTDAWMIAERIREGIAALVVQAIVGGETMRIEGLSTSIGIAMFPASGRSLEDLVQAADTALYTAKREGRNRVVTADAA